MHGNEGSGRRRRDDPDDGRGDDWRDTDEDEDWEDEGWEDSEDGWSSDGEMTEPCPYCGHEIYEGSPRCPSCGQYISSEDAPRRPKPWWWGVGVFAGLYAVYRWILG